MQAGMVPDGTLAVMEFVMVKSGPSSAARRRAAARVLFEDGAEPALVAAALGIAVASLDRIVAKEGWAPPEPHADRLGGTLDRLLEQLSAQLLRFEAATDEEEGLSKAQLDALLAITRTFDRLSEMKREEEARGSGRRDEAELKRARATVERRVGELAEQRAETIIDHLGRTR